MDTLISLLEGMQAHIRSLMERLDIDAKRRRVTALEEEASTAEFWSAPDQAQRVMQEISKLKAEIERWETLATRIDDALELARLNDPSLLDELTEETRELEKIVERMALQTMFSGEYDNENAILAIHAGAGGTDSQDWAQMLERMYLRWAEENGYKVEIIERSEGEEAGIKSVMLSVKGDYAYGYLQSEQGVHREGSQD
jgi:peptide chain release factor 2